MNFLALFTGYLFGSFQTSYILSKLLKGTDIRRTGSFNAGTSNMVQTFGWKLGILTFAGDVLKVILPLCIAKYYFNTEIIFNLLLGIGAVLGHNFPFYMNFKGGKGTATTIGMLLIFDYRVFLITVIILVGAALITDYIALASLVAIATIPISIYFFNNALTIAAISLILPVMSTYLHRVNITHMITKEEKKISSVFKTK